MLRLITINPDYSIKINMLETVANVKFNRVLTRNHSSETNSSAHNNSKQNFSDQSTINLNTLEMVFIVLYSEKFIQDSTYAAIDSKLRTEMIRVEIGLSTDWQPDEVVKEAISEYIRIQSERNPSLVILNNLHASLLTSANGIEAFNRSSKNAIARLDSLYDIEKDRPLTPEEFQLLLQCNEIIVGNLGKIVDIGGKIPKTLASVGELIHAVKKEQGDARVVKGGGIVGRREDPK
jgi:hypothetical protein